MQFFKQMISFSNIRIGARLTDSGLLSVDSAFILVFLSCVEKKFISKAQGHVYDPRREWHWVKFTTRL